MPGGGRCYPVELFGWSKFFQGILNTLSLNHIAPSPSNRLYLSVAHFEAGEHLKKICHTEKESRNY